MCEQPAPNVTAKNECDSNADTCCLGKNFVVLEYTNVYSFNNKDPPSPNVPIVTGATAWTDPFSEQTYILVLNEALYYGSKLDHSLIDPNQIRHFGIPLWDNPFDSAHKISVGPVNENGLIIPLTTQGTRIFFDSRSPSPTELATCPHIQLTLK